MPVAVRSWKERRLTDFITTVERLLSTDDANLAAFLRYPRAHLIALRLEQYDFLRPFRDSAAGLNALGTTRSTKIA